MKVYHTYYLATDTAVQNAVLNISVHAATWKYMCVYLRVCMYVFVKCVSNSGGHINQFTIVIPKKVVNHVGMAL